MQWLTDGCGWHSICDSPVIFVVGFVVLVLLSDLASGTQVLGATLGDSRSAGLLVQ